MGGFRVDHDQLREHAAHLDEQGQNVVRIGSAAETMSLDSAFGTNAFGILCAFLPPVIGKLVPTTAASIIETGQTILSAAEGVRTMADNYQATDDAIADGLNQLDPEAAAER